MGTTEYFTPSSESFELGGMAARVEEEGETAHFCELAAKVVIAASHIPLSQL
jgi:hypothetical protein